MEEIKMVDSNSYAILRLEKNAAPLIKKAGNILLHFNSRSYISFTKNNE